MLILTNLAVYPMEAVLLEVGSGVIIAIRDALAAQVRSMGFDRLRVTARRVKGARPGKEIDVTIDLLKD
jgi:hypothetical protein